MSLRDSLQESNRKTSGIENLVFKQNVNLRFSKKDSAITFRILPAIYRDENGRVDKSQYLAYRDADDRFTDWAVVYKQHRFIGGKLNILSPQYFHGATFEDPVDLLWETANNDQRFYQLICKSTTDGKFSRDAYKFAALRAPSWNCAMNTIDPNDVENPEKVSILSVSKTAIFKRNYLNLPDQDGDSGATCGLADYLDEQNRRDLIPEGTPQWDFNARFVLGDITSPIIEGRRGGLAVCVVRLEDAPQGGLQTYNCRVLDLPRIPGTSAMLTGRYDFDTEAFVELEIDDYMDRVAAALKGLADDLLFAAWNNKGPHYDAALSRAGISSGATAVPGAFMGRRPSDSAPVPQPQRSGVPQPSRPQGGVSFVEDDDDDIPLEPETPPVTIRRPAPPTAAIPPTASVGVPAPAPQTASGIKRKGQIQASLQQPKAPPTAEPEQEQDLGEE